MSPLQGKRILLTGGNGFLGRAVLARLCQCKPGTVFAPRSHDYDLRDRLAIRKFFTQAKSIDVVIHCAATCGGIGANQAEPGRFFFDNALMGLLLMEESRLFGVQKYVQIGTTCSYPKYAAVPLQESELYLGYPEETNAPYGLAKRMLIVQAQAYRRQYGFNAATLIPANLYGPGDNFDLKTSHVIPALIRKCIEARDDAEDHIDAWGTGEPSREFLYVDDAADGIVRAAESYNSEVPCNLGTGQEISIKTLAELIANLCGYKGYISWDGSKPNGQMRRCLDTSLAFKEFGWLATIPLFDGLKRTIEWYEANRLTEIPC